MAYIELDPDLLLLAAEGGDYNCREAIARIQDMKSAERRLLREAIDRLDDWYDEAVLDMHLQDETQKNKRLT